MRPYLNSYLLFKGRTLFILIRRAVSKVSAGVLK
jgi:hypothetical protein